MTIFDETLADEIRAELARQRVTMKGLAEKSRFNRDTLRSRLNGKTPFSMSEFFAVTNALGLNQSQLVQTISDRVAGKAVGR